MHGRGPGTDGTDSDGHLATSCEAAAEELVMQVWSEGNCEDRAYKAGNMFFFVGDMSD